MAKRQAATEEALNTLALLTEQQQLCIEQLLTGNTKQAAATAVGVAPYTVSRWYKEAEFVAALNRRRIEIHGEHADRLRGLAASALDVLAAGLDSEREVIRLQAAQAILKAVRLADVGEPSNEITAERVMLRQMTELC